MRVARPKSPVVDFSGWATVPLLFGVLGEGNGIFFEDFKMVKLSFEVSSFGVDIERGDIEDKGCEVMI